MKSFLAITFLAVVGLACAFKSPDEVQAEALAYVEDQITLLLRKPAIGRSGGGLACYDKYIPLITAATENSKKDTAICVQRASSQREDESNKVKQQRSTLNHQVESVQELFKDCSKHTDDLRYLSCIRDNSQVLQSTVQQVSSSATSLANGLSTAYTNIASAEDRCTQTVLEKVKADTDALTGALQNCLMNGFDEPQPELPTTTAPGMGEAGTELAQ
uniref:Protein TsetseEP domain-containing protein n=1 Tax=Stomoxys calcitrans TaxID=35570 RepID=A0A1I8P5J0_STOCA